ncbi:B12-binding domain-containing radical SAM protein [Dechloromonas denitrificans]|uniref:B12-binding domain-containing radical SAM protein n=1 Tax=Dechloromonas denitrificans TaxID=281362 RepID=UPI001CF7FD4B|nr:radical SAM protein [Dechloromonas denitrificans]UCV03075.1 B12-binding domain-containing radical SAM protein [Dechloromonas denitrificans]
MINPPSIVLTTLNAKYIHASLGLRYLLANMGDLKPRTALREFTIGRPAQEIVDELLLLVPGLASTPPIIGFGVYIWNVLQTTAVLRLLKAARPDIKVILGGPEVSHETNEQEITRLADHVITGWGDLSFAKLCRALLHGPRPLSKVIAGEQPALDQLVLPYAEYSAADLAHRLLYVEASRGCPFKCEFCLSALDKTAWAFDLERFLAEMDGLYRRGARNFKFVDRTFNLKIDVSVRILQFFLDRLPAADATSPADALFVHFEVVPDHLPDRLKAMIARFPSGVLQFEVGIQSFNIDVQQRISRRQDNAKAEANLRWLVEASHAHLHTDLIFGLPGETLDSFAAGFDRLYDLRPHEIQLGILKRLRGTPITRHTAEYGMLYDENPPYSVCQTGAVDAATVQRFGRFARYWDMLANSGRFKQTLPLLLGQWQPASGEAAARTEPSPFQAFLDFSDWLWQSTGKTTGLTPESLVDLLFDYLVARSGWPAPTARSALLADYVASGARGAPRALHGQLPKREPPQPRVKPLTQRQGHHQAGLN